MNLFVYIHMRMGLLFLLAYGDNLSVNLTVQAQGVACHLQVLTTLSYQVIFSP